MTPAQQITTKLLAEKLTFTPVERDGRQGFDFKATGTVEELLAGTVGEFPQAVVPPTGFAALYQLEIRGEIRRTA